MKWLKTLLMKWLGINEVRTENAELIQRLDVLSVEIAGLRNLIGSAECAISSDGALIEGLSNRMKVVDGRFDGVRTDLIDIVKASERDSQRISELETVVKDATLDTALAALEDRVSKIEATPVPTPGPQGRRGGSAWNSHQVAASAGAARENGVNIPIPTPGVS